MEDNYRHKGLRKLLVEVVRKKGIKDERILTAIGKIPRHFFITDNAFVKYAYEDNAFPIGSGQTISQPYTVAFQTELLELKKGEKILEIGTGSGYQSAVLLELGARVYTIERQKVLYEKTKTFLPSIGYSPNFFFGDGYKGLPAYAPYDKILVTCGAPSIPGDLVSQLKPGGRMVIPIGPGDIQEMTLIEKKEDSSLIISKMGQFRFVPMLGEKEWKGEGY
ncbi:MAG: protein-L-isoaspartate(D-aspartate) O-methyltransferase [Bacteroidetes bacterium]|nr:protein-L-isoaspartate(D-aspartate) O-methyltransferase [Bacteroidota bacterium]